MKFREFSFELAGKTIVIKKSELAGQANGSVIAQYGETVVLATAVISKNQRVGIDFFPLMVDFEEKYYAAGKIGGSRFVKRETRASENAILTARLIDRTLRPLFNQATRNDVQVIVTALSVDQENDPDILSVLAASAALATSDIPWNGPVAGVRIGRNPDGILIVNPTYEEMKGSDLDLVITGTKDRINMIEAGAKEISEETMLEACALAQTQIGKLVDFQKEIIQAIGLPKMEISAEATDEELLIAVKEFLNGTLEQALYIKDKKEREGKMEELKKSLTAHIEEKYPDNQKKTKNAAHIYEEEIDRVVHENIIKLEKRPDGRATDELRELDCSTAILPRTHGSGLFMRGETQILSILTLGSPGDKQIIDGMEISEMKRFMHHYNFPPYSVGEVKPMRGPSRRDIGHGALAERAMESLIPDQKDFPYTIRLVSETLSSNGSSSMASVCASILAMMDGGVPIKKMAGGIAMGLMSDKEGNYKVLTDIQGPEDHYGDMDLKVAGTEDGITALQMDVKIEGATINILKDAFAQAKKARLEIIAKMKLTIEKPRQDLSIYAPRIITLQINPDRIKDVIGPGGKIINEIINETGVSIDIEDDGQIFITSAKADAVQKAVEWIKNITREAKVGEIFQGIVKRIMDFGAFVEIFPGTEGLVHISKLSDQRVARVEDVVHVGDMISVKLMEIDDRGRLSLSMKDATKKEEE